MTYIKQLVHISIRTQGIFKLLLPFDKGSIYERLKSDTTIIETNYTADGMFVKVVLTPYLYNLYKPYIIN